MIKVLIEGKKYTYHGISLRDEFEENLNFSELEYSIKKEKLECAKLLSFALPNMIGVKFKGHKVMFFSPDNYKDFDLIVESFQEEFDV